MSAFIALAVGGTVALSLVGFRVLTAAIFSTAVLIVTVGALALLGVI